MSFGRAKINRFNEDTSCAPPPGTYDPKWDSKVKGAVVEKSKRFPDQLCVSTSLDGLDRPNTLPVTFRTPQVVRRVIPLTPRLKHLAANNFDTPGSGSSTDSTACITKSSGKKDFSRADYQRLENELSELSDQHLNEMMQKNLEINLLKDEINEIKRQEQEILSILKEKSNITGESRKNHLKVKESLDCVVEQIKNERECYKKYIDELEEKIATLQSDRDDLQQVIQEKKNTILSMNNKYLDLKEELEAVHIELQCNSEIMMRSEEKNSEVLKKVILCSEEKIEELDKSIQSKLHNLEEYFDAAQHKAHVDFHSKLNLMSNEFRLKREEIEREMKKYTEQFKELEKSVNQKTKDFIKNIEEANESCKLMYRELLKVESQRDDLVVSDLEKKLSIIEIQEKADLYKNDFELCSDKCKKFEITLNTMQETIKALTGRLLDSDKEVERLSNVELDLEAQKKNLEEKSHALLSDISALREGMNRLEREIICDVTAVNEHLVAEVEDFKAEASKRRKAMTSKINEYKSTIDMLLKENDYYKNELAANHDYINELKTKKEKLKEDHLLTKEELRKTKDEFSEKLSAQKNVCMILNGEVKKSKEVIGEFQSYQDALKKEMTALEETCEKCQNKLEVAEKEILTLQKIISDQFNELKVLKQETQSYQQDLNKKNEIETTQKLHIDELISDLVLEKERCLALESEKDQTNLLLSEVQVSNEENARRIAETTSQVEALKECLRNAEKRIHANEEEKAMLEDQVTKCKNRIKELENVVSKSKEESENKINELQSELSSANERLQVEETKLERYNIHKAEYILEFSVNIDTLKERIADFERKTLCLETEKKNLCLQLTDSSRKIFDLQSSIDTKNIIIDGLTKDLNDLNALYQNVSSQNDQLLKSLEKSNELLSLDSDNAIKLSEAEEKIESLQVKLTEREEELANRIAYNDELLMNSSIKLSESEKIINQLQEKLADKNNELSNLKTEIDGVNRECLAQRRESEKSLAELAKKVEDYEKQRSYTALRGLQEEKSQLVEEVENLRLMLQAVTKDRDKIDRELAELMGHQNIHQKIKHVNQLKQANVELKEKCTVLEAENIKLKKRLGKSKENATSVQHENTPKTLKTRKLPSASPGVLKDRNT